MKELSLILGFLLLVITVATSACTFSKLDDDLNEYEKVSHEFSGTVTAPDG